MDLFKRLEKMKQEEARKQEEEDVKMGVRPKLGVLNWTRVLRKVLELIELFEAQERVADWQGDGSCFGSPAACSHEQPALVNASRCSDSGANVSFKARVYKELIAVGDPLGLRKCKQSPEVEVRKCSHPAERLMGSGNQSQREVWCTSCHQRWLVDPQVMMDLASKKTEVRVGDRVLRAGGPRVETPVAGKNVTRMLKTPVSSAYLAQPETPLRTQGSMNVVTTPVSTPKRPPTVRSPSSVVRCFCGQPAEKLTVKKETARKGRHFYKCSQRVCDFFQWDAQEIRHLQLTGSPEMRQMAEDEMMETHRHEMNQVIQATMEEAERRHMQTMEGQHQAYQAQMEHLHSQLVWMTAVAGEEKLAEIMNNPQLQEEMNRKAMELKKNMEEIEKRAAANSGAGGSNM